MTTLVRDVMSTKPFVLSPENTIAEAAEYMRDGGIGDVLVVDEDRRLLGLVTDRDIVVRGVAEHCNPDSTPLSAVCTQNLLTVQPDDAVDTAAQLMRDRAIRRMPVVRDGRPVGVVTLADLNETTDALDALRGVNAASPNT